jgi:phosphoglucomutase
MLMIDLADGRRIAVRPSGTEPKIKFYLFARRAPAASHTFTPAELAPIKSEVKASLEALWTWVQADVKQRLA